ncbi:MAG: 16S rRNA (uracil(1498)-N(3))-methyltransferase [Propionibacteriaceae bacterium]|nr:16S rRNA (uracil(1498)-N(3))-methyltransferase [Propionibacteriaceae bacterium]
MSHPLFLASFGDVVPGQVVSLTGDEGRHAAVVRRIRRGETVLVADGAGRAVEGVVVAAERDRLDVEAGRVLEEPRRAYRLVAVQALAKGERSDLAVELLTETGADEIIAWQAERSIVQWSGQRGEKSLAKWAATARAATKQSRRFTVPAVSHATTRQLLERLAGTTAYVLHESATDRLAEAVAGFCGPEIVVIVGPEGGISPRELELFAGVGAHPVLLTSHVLRTSSAGGIALAQVQAVLG